MTASELRDILLSPGFREDLQEMSSYLASIMQERPIVYAVAKALWKQRRFKYQLEAKRKDLIVDGTHIEFKFNYDKMAQVLQEELTTWSDLHAMWEAVKQGQKSKSWGVMAKIYEDVCGESRQPHLFVWVICSRDLSGVVGEDLKRICGWRDQCKYNAVHPYKSRDFLAVTDSFLDRMQAIRSFSVLKEAIETNGDFPSTYHFRICDFQPQVR